MRPLCIEPGSRLFRVRDIQGQAHRLSSYLLREALSGDGVCFPEDLQSMTSPPEVTELWPWSAGGGIANFAQAETYMVLLRKRFSQMFRRPEWRIVLSPYLLESQGHAWSALLRDVSIRRFQLVSNLECLAWRETEQAPAVYLHWGSGGADLGICLQGETYQYQRLFGGEANLLARFREALMEFCGARVSADESFRVLRVAVGTGLTFPSGRLVEVGVERLERAGDPARISLPQEVLLQTILGLLTPELEAIEDFVRRLQLDDHRDLFRQGLHISGGGAALPLIRDWLSEVFEFPLRLSETPELEVLGSSRLH